MPQMNRLRKRTANALQVSGRDAPLLSKVVDVVLIALILGSVIATILESVPSLAIEWEREFYWFEAFTVVVFSIEYVLRVWSSIDLPEGRYQHPITGRIRYCLSPFAIIDLVAILPFYLFFFGHLDLRFLRILRLLRIFKLTRYSGAFSALAHVLEEQSKSIFAAMSLLFIMLVLSASVMHMVEKDIQPEVFGTIPESMWWAVVTLTTVGYGDVTPVTTLGKIIGGLVSIIGVCMAALPAGLLASGFSAQFLRQNQEYAQVVDRALEDGELSPEEGEALERLRETMGISTEDADRLLRNALRETARNPQQCPHCGESLK